MNTTKMNTDQIAAEAVQKLHDKGLVRCLSDFQHAESIIKAAIKKATKPKDEALLKIFEWGRRNAPYPEYKIEGNTLLQDICEQGLGYWPPSRAARASEQE